MDRRAEFDSSVSSRPALFWVSMGDSLSDTDGERMRRWAAGDRAAFEEIVRAWERPMGRFLARMTGDAHEASDLTQELFLRVYLNGSAYRDAGTFRTWLYRIALNLARDSTRRKVRKPCEPWPILHDPACEVGSDDLDERAALVAAALAELPEAQREVVVLKHYEAMNFEAMARLLGIPATTLKSRFAVAMTKLEAALTRRGLKPEETT
jgi:RNA polymerase sigma factor (sigma-70 family)